jgi:hypothetical protein
LRIRNTSMRIRNDPAFHLNADPDPLQGDSNLRPLSILSLRASNVSVHSPSRLNFKALEFDFNADLDPAFHSNVDPDPSSKNNADPGKHCQYSHQLNDEQLQYFKK